MDHRFQTGIRCLGRAPFYGLSIAWPIRVAIVEFHDISFAKVLKPICDCLVNQLKNTRRLESISDN